jgi:hypothetical protein
MGFGIIGGLDPRIGTIKAYQMNSIRTPNGRKLNNPVAIELTDCGDTMSTWIPGADK